MDGPSHPSSSKEMESPIEVQQENELVHLQDQRILTTEQVESWRNKGFCVVEAKSADDNALSGWFMTAKEAERFRYAARVSVLGDGKKIKPLPDLKNFGGLGFPFLSRYSQSLNDLALHPRITQGVRELLGLAQNEVPLLSQAECWVKRDADANPNLPMEFVNTDQRMHCDYPNHYLTHPPPWDQPEAVAMIVYLDDGEECGGPTAYVSREGETDEAYAYPYVHMPGVGDIPWLNDRTCAEAYLKENHPASNEFRKKLYEREQYVRYKVGTVLIYRLDLWHRGTPLHPNKDRAVVNLLFKRSEAKHITSWHRGWAVSFRRDANHRGINFCSTQ